MPVYQVIVLAVVLGTGAPVYLHHATHGVFNVHQVALAFFFGLNAIVAFWEVCLFLEIDRVETQFAKLETAYAGRELEQAKSFFGSKIGFRQIFAPSTWAELWSSYALFDPSYADRKSYGFFIDVGNGFLTLLPSLAIAYGMTYHVVSARILGLVMMMVCYQMWYGTVIYFASYVKNRRYRGHDKRNVALIVGLSNGVWFTFPVWGIWIAIQLIYTDSYGVFLK